MLWLEKFKGNMEGHQTQLFSSTPILGRKTGAGEEIRTLDPNLGKVVLYP